MQKSLTQLATEIHQAKNSPGLLSELYIDIAVIYSSLTDEYKDLKLLQAEFWNIKEFDENGEQRKKPLSDKSVEMQWIRTENGKKQTKFRYTLKALDKLSQAVKSANIQNSISARQDNY